MAGSESADPKGSGVVSPSMVVMAAGIGSRYGGLKQVDPVGPSGEMIIDYSVFDALRAGFERVVFVIRSDIEADFRDVIGNRLGNRIDTAYVFQNLDTLPDGFAVPGSRVKPWGTAHAVLCARDAVPGAFAAINADDFYGAGAFAAVGRHLGGGSPDYCMAGYRLDHTLSEHGHVSRGVCEVTGDGLLRGIVERETIRAFTDGIKYEAAGGSWVPLPDDAVVSMNIWGFGHAFFDHLDAAFRTFLENRIDEPGAECYLPAVVDDLVAEGSARVRVLPTDERWFGITYREDRPTVQRAILGLIGRGVYPERLWA
ncbi:MAG: nucleotidyltransferase [Candidatus Eisenbacteria bacterium]|nr:nucleotidyltransferase [Candidatus Eisenbacteria bacterium]